MSGTTSTDVVVVGAGVAGLMAGLAAREAGRNVVVVGRAGGATPNWSGSIDVADDLVDVTPGPHSPGLARGGRLHENVLRIARDRPRHPFARFAPSSSSTSLVESVDDALATLATAVPDLALVRRPDGHNHVLATVFGTVKRAGLVPLSQHLDLAELPPEAVVGVVEWLDLAHFSAGPVVALLRSTSGLGGTAVPTFVPVRVPRLHADRDVWRDARAMARALDDVGFRDRALGALRGVIEQLSPRPTHLLTPAVLGSRPLPVNDVAAIDGMVGVPLRELLAQPPSVPGERLMLALRARAAALGVVVIDGVVSDPVVDGERLTRVTVRSGPQTSTLTCAGLVLASGRFIGGGVVRDQVARETLFGLPVHTEGRVVDDLGIDALVGERVADAHAIFRAGVLTDEAQRPLTATRRPLAENVFAAGTVVAGHDPARDGSGLAVAAWLGRLAGLRASEVVR